MANLKPCPFCGAKPWTAEFHAALPPRYRVFCSDPACLAKVDGRTEKRAAIRWNRRAAPVVDLEQFREAVEAWRSSACLARNPRPRIEEADRLLGLIAQQPGTEGRSDD